MTDTNQLNWQRTNLENIETAWEDDLWDRKRLGIQLTNYVDRLQCGAVLALDARWGEGKTWFVRHWQKHLEDENHNVIYLDAFANDYLDDPFLTIAAEISQAFKSSDNIDDGDYVLIDSEAKNPENGDYVLSIIDGAANIKKFRKDKERGLIMLISESSSNYDPIYIHQDDASSYSVAGKVLGVLKN